MTEPIKPADLYKNGICECKINMKGKHIWFNTVLHPSKQFSAYMCIKCNRPVYHTLKPPVS